MEQEKIKTETKTEVKIPKKGKILPYIFYTLFILVFLWVLGQLFFQKEIEVIENMAHSLFGVNQVEKVDIENLRVVFPNEPAVLDPRDGDPVARQRLVNIYQPLVKFDAFYNLRPCLALSWGMIDDLTWEFNLRPDVVFHDGSKFDAYDVDSTLDSQFIDSFESFEIVDDLTIRIKTKYPDPLMLQKLALILIYSDEAEDLSYPIGTGSYKYNAYEDSVMTLDKFDDYWGEESKFETVELITIPDKSDRVNAFLSGDADMLAFVSYDAVQIVQEFGFEIATIPTLEVQLIMFNFASEYLSNIKNRELISYIIDQDALVEKVGGYARPVNQFVSNGIFGFDSSISNHEFDLEKAEALAVETGLQGKTLQLHLPIGLDVLGEHIRENLAEVGVNVIVSYLQIPDFIDSIDNGRADFYFMGFKSELGDSSEFLETTLHSEGDYNTFDYENSNVDYLIDLAAEELDPGKRREALQEAMRVVVEDDVVGVPLFEYETVYSFVEELDFSPRIDGLINFDEINIK
ncbi:MAG: ABC transporter substrate-binding protein [Nitrospirota bacterium]